MGQVIYVDFSVCRRVIAWQAQHFAAADRLEIAAGGQDKKTAATLRRLASEYRKRAR